MFFIKKFKKDIWNLRLITRVIRFKYLLDLQTKVLVNCFYNFSLRYKYFFIFFFKKYKKNVKAFKKKFKPFTYRIDVIEKRTTFKKWKFRFVTLRLVKYFYSILSYKQFRRISRIAKCKIGLYEENYLLLLEGRLINFLYRTGLVETIFQSYYYIKAGFININSKIKTYPNDRIGIFDIMTFSPLISPFIYCDYFIRIYQFIILHPPIRCVFVSIFFYLLFFL